MSTTATTTKLVEYRKEGGIAVHFRFDSTGGRKFAEITRNRIRRGVSATR